MLALLLVACPKAPDSTASLELEKPKATQLPAIATTEAATSAVVAEEVDLNGDGTPDVFNYVQGGALVRRDVDLNRDGRVDVRTYYTNDTIAREELDGDFDGRFDWIDHYEAGVRTRAEIDTDYDGRVNLISYFSGGLLTKKERDSDGDGLIDYWETYDAEGNEIETLRDENGDGWPDSPEDEEP